MKPISTKEPNQKQSKFRGILMVATAIMLISSGLKMIKNRNAGLKPSNT